jgi:isochorismate pyruvate lyase
MPETPPDPDSCQSMDAVRAGVDALDAALVALLAQRFAYMRAAARIKPERGQVRDEARKRKVIANVRARADALGIPGDVLAEMWDRLVEGSIAYEYDRWDEANRD